MAKTDPDAGPSQCCGQLLRFWEGTFGLMVTAIVIALILMIPNANVGVYFVRIDA